MNKILVIDDVQTNLTLFAKVVTQLPECEAVSFTSSRDALKWSDGNALVLVVVDQNMPELNGIDFIQAFRHLKGHSDTPIVMITGNADKELQREALRRGASAFLTKPVDPIAFLSLAHNLMALRRAGLATLHKQDESAVAAAQRASDVESLERATIDALARVIERRDARTGDHCRRVALFSEVIAKKMLLPFNDVRVIKEAARIHDIGKLSVPDSVLQKSSRLVADERTQAKHHVYDGRDILAGFPTVIMRAAAEIAYAHHERFDGTGYPSALAGAAIPLYARIVGVADTFSAMTSRRPWREAYSVGQATEFVKRETGTGFDPKVTAAFADAMPELLDVRAEVPDLVST